MNTSVKVSILASAVILLTILTVGYMGFIPVVSDAMGTTKPVDLGVNYTEADVDSATAKLGYINAAPQGGSSNAAPSLYGSSEKSVTLTSSEITALLNHLSIEWDSFPASNIQVDLAEDGTISASGTILVDRVDNFVECIGSVGSAERYLPLLSLIKTNPRFHLQFTVSVKDDMPRVDVLSASVGSFSAAESELQEAENQLNNKIKTIISRHGYKIGGISVTEGSITFNGTLPETITLGIIG